MGSQFPTRQQAKLGGHNGQVLALAYSKGSGQYLLTGCTDRTIRLFNPQKAIDASSNSTTSSFISSSSYSSGSSYARNIQSQISNASLIQTYNAHGYEVLDISISSDNSRFTSVGGDKLIFFWDVAEGKTIRRWSGHAGRVNCCTFGGPDSDVVVTGSFDATIKLWDAKSNSGKPLMTLSDAKDSISSVEVRDEWIWAGCIDGRVRCYDVRMGRCGVDVIGHPVTSVTPTKQADSVLTSSLDSTLRLMDRDTGKLLQSFKDPNFTNTSYRLRSTLCLNDSIALSGSEDGSIYAWDLLDGKTLHEMRHSDIIKPEGQNAKENLNKKDLVSAVVWCEERKQWASAGGDGSVVIWGR